MYTNLVLGEQEQAGPLECQKLAQRHLSLSFSQEQNTKSLASKAFLLYHHPLSKFADVLCSERLDTAEMSKYSWIIVSQQDYQETSPKKMGLKICLKGGIDFPLEKQNSPNKEHEQVLIFARVSLCNNVERLDWKEKLILLGREGYGITFLPSCNTSCYGTQ